ncbi:pkinase-domain-containing protein [Lichtheimia corymbifera JMRC:FSU:9682]|uniref:non-specific serine/threonine protein kinase n=1 Tax=Lichtheimia corymbifera JMRC:FSU:9682 TaxID=1263082 RepID=A0A068S2E9_9FUNG|nr:pkinase-domain-containing protein [Lichtheimia corymbifera JMRC:FSU:9682]
MMTMLVPSSNATVESQPPPPPTTTASTAIHTPSLFATTDEMPSGPPPSRSFSVMAPTELQRSVQRQYDTTTTTEDLPWWQHYYQMYHYHPPQGRKPTLFGPYLLLHTLGEGEFGKVKLGIHIDSSQEVAIKLIKKDNIDSSTRMSKVEREISVLRTVCHPYIVKLYDVIETEKYIGIILQCASGGELFEYILAHRYLKERDACRLFAQLISGVHYMHQKHIVHRDLKLENLLLDRDRNVIITDFGFANQFSSAKDDLMATSCGSPCYAAPELVVSEGMYVGSAVDIWSCGVILYAMLCGYLPFDDDPANPEGDNINLLYKYILNTQLAFPDYVSDGARDLLQKMLVPDPTKRCTMQTIMEHPWLQPHRDLFRKTIDVLEREAMETADLPMPVNNSSNGQKHHQQRNDQQSTAEKEHNVQHTRPLNDDHCTTDLSTPAAISAPSSDDAMVPCNLPMDVDSEHQVPDIAEPYSQKPAASTEQLECNVKGTMSATAADLAVPEISSIELPASMHTSASESTTMATEKHQKQDPIEEQHQHQQPTTTTTPGGSILQAKFLSSIQRQGNAQQQQQQQPPSSSHYHHSAALSKSTPPQQPIPFSITSTSTRHRSPSTALPLHPPPQKSHYEPRRKALSLLVNSVADHLQAQPSTSDRHHHHTGRKGMAFSRKQGNRERAQSVLSQGRYSGFRGVVGKGSENSNDALPRSSMHVMPSVSERAGVFNDKDKHKSAGKKLMEWFKKKPLSTKDRSFNHLAHGDLLTSDRPLSSLHSPLRAMPLGKSYAVDFNDAKLRTHHGAVDQEALTSGSPMDVLVEVKQVLLSMGIEVKKDGDYKLKCTRQRRKRPNSITASSNNPASCNESATSSLSNARSDKKRRMSTSAPFRKLLRRNGGGGDDSSSSVFQQGETVYGDPVVDPGEEVRFSVELCKIKNLPGLYIVDIRRMRGNVWAYKFLYHTLLDTLNLSGKGGYIKSHNTMKQQQQQPIAAVHPPPAASSSTTSTSTSSSQHRSSIRNNTNRNSCSSSGGSSSMLEDVKEEE